VVVVVEPELWVEQLQVVKILVKELEEMEWSSKVWSNSTKLLQGTVL
jgi:hypothetical protein